ncbi:stage V sporulation protein AD [Clostridiales bacterium]|nr:stage V sporulation protein AD [Clostridiales bacterium]
MMTKRLGKHTTTLDNPVYIVSSASTAGKKEGEGPLKDLFDKVLDDDMYGEKSWEMAESKLVRDTMKRAVQKAQMSEKDMDFCISGDLLNQVSATTFGIREMNIPFLGIYGACSTMGEAMGIGSMLIDGGFAENVLAGASSHFCAAEKQYRAPLGMGNQRPQTTTWTVTGDGAVVLSKKQKGRSPKITEVLTGKIVDMGIKDPNNMGAAMAPAAAELMISYFEETGRDPDYFDVIATGDLGYVGHTLMVELLAAKGYLLDSRYTDCGIEIFDKDNQDTHSGGSGCACSALVFTAKFYKMLSEGKIRRMLFMPTGALMSPTTSQQGESIPSIAHGIVIESGC